MRRLSVLLAAIALTLLLWAAAGYGVSPPSLSHAVDEQPSGTAWALLAGLPSWPLLSGASATAGAGVVQGHVYDYAGDPVGGVEVGAMVLDDQGSPLWSGSATTDAGGFYSVSGAPASTHGLLNGTTGTDEWVMWDLTFADPGTSTYDVRLGRVAWSATRGRTAGGLLAGPVLHMDRRYERDGQSVQRVRLDAGVQPGREQRRDRDGHSLDPARGRALDGLLVRAKRGRRVARV